jgi:glutathione S-transferase
MNKISASAPCRSVLMVASALKLKLNLKPIDLMEKQHLTASFLQINPHHTVPTLVDNEFSLSESRAICIYLVEKYGRNDSLYPKNPKVRATINQLLYFDMGTLFYRAIDYYMPYFSGGALDIQKLELLNETFKLFNALITDKKFVVGYRLTIADLILIASVSSVEAFGYDLNPYKNVVGWYENIKNVANHIYQQNQDGLNELKKFLPIKPIESNDSSMSPYSVQGTSENEIEPTMDVEPVIVPTPSIYIETSTVTLDTPPAY